MDGTTMSIIAMSQASSANIQAIQAKEIACQAIINSPHDAKDHEGMMRLGECIQMLYGNQPDSHAPKIIFLICLGAFMSGTIYSIVSNKHGDRDYVNHGFYGLMSLLVTLTIVLVGIGLVWALG